MPRTIGAKTQRLLNHKDTVVEDIISNHVAKTEMAKRYNVDPRMIDKVLWITGHREFVSKYNQELFSKNNGNRVSPIAGALQIIGNTATPELLGEALSKIFEELPKLRAQVKEYREKYEAKVKENEKLRQEIAVTKRENDNLVQRSAQSALAKYGD